MLRTLAADLSVTAAGTALRRDFLVRRVRACGGFSWKGRKIFISEVLRNEPIGFELIEDDFWLVYFAAFPIALFDSYKFSIHDLPEQDPTEDGNDGSDGKVESK